MFSYHAQYCDRLFLTGKSQLTVRE